jgi:iron uptake system component EfeO
MLAAMHAAAIPARLAPRLLIAATSLLSAALLAGCGAKPQSHAPASPAGPVITITASTCGTGWRHPAAGLQTLQIRNGATATVEVTLVGSSSGAVYAKLEGVGPGTTRAMPVDLGSGAYAFECDGNDYGTRVGPSVTVPGHVRGGFGVLPVTASQMITASTQEEAYVGSGLARLARQTVTLAAEIRSGNLAAARITWLAGHLAFERLGSAYGMFGDYDDEINGTPFGLAGGVSSKDFTGFYRLEYGLWHGQPAAELTGPADQLAVDVRSLATAWPGMQLQPPFALSDLALRTHEVLENAMQFQLSGQDNFGSGTNMAMLAAGIDATRAQLAILHPLLVSRYQNLPALYGWLNRLQQLVVATHTSRGWLAVSDLSATQLADLDSAAGETVEMLAEIPPMFEDLPMP